jgi:hypothetical protein
MNASPIGKLPPRYTFILNPYTDARFTRCPNCGQRTKVRKLPLFIHVEPLNPIVLGKTCRYCPQGNRILITGQHLEQICFAPPSFQSLCLDAALGRFLLPQQVESNVAQDSQVLCAIAFANPAFIFSKGDV